MKRRFLLPKLFLLFLCSSTALSANRQTIDFLETWAPIGLLRVRSGPLEKRCTGTLVGPRQVLTAGECLDLGPDQEETDLSIEFILQARGDAYTARAKAVKIIAPGKARVPGSVEQGTDIVLLQLDADLGDKVGWFLLESKAVVEKSECRVLAYSPDHEDGKVPFVQTDCEVSESKPYRPGADGEDGNFVIPGKFGATSIGSPVLVGSGSDDPGATQRGVAGVLTSKTKSEGSLVNGVETIWNTWVRTLLVSVFDDLFALGKRNPALRKMGVIDQEKQEKIDQMVAIYNKAIFDQFGVKPPNDAKLDFNKLSKKELEIISLALKYQVIAGAWKLLETKWANMDGEERKRELEKNYLLASENDPLVVLGALGRLFDHRADILYSPPKRGIGVGAYFYFPLRINILVPESRAEKAGLRVGDIILNVEERKYASLLDLQAVVARGKETVQLEVLRAKDGEKLTLDSTPLKITVRFDIVNP